MTKENTQYTTRHWREQSTADLGHMIHTCLRNVIGRCPMAWASPMLALITSVKGFFTPWKNKRAAIIFLYNLIKGHQYGKQFLIVESNAWF